MKSVTLTRNCAVSLECFKPVWSIKSDEVMHLHAIEDEIPKLIDFVRLSTRNSSLSRVLGHVGDRLCLNRSNGYRELLKLHNATAFAHQWHRL